MVPPTRAVRQRTSSRAPRAPRRGPGARHRHALRGRQQGSRRQRQTHIQPRHNLSDILFFILSILIVNECK